MGADMNVRVETDLASIPADKWNGLLPTATTGTVFQTHQWHVAWWEAYGTENSALVLCVVEDGELVGLAPLMLCGPPHGPRTLCLMGSGRSDYLDFIYPRENPRVLDEIIKYLADHRRDWDAIELKHIPDYSATAARLRAVCSDNGLYGLLADAVACPALAFTYDETGKVTNPIKKKSLARHHSYFLKQDSYRVQHLTDGQVIAGYLDVFFDQHVARWNSTDTPSLFLDSANRAFYRELVAAMDGSGWILLTVLEVLGKVVAFHFGFEYGNKLLWYKPSFEIELAKRSPGEALLKELLDYAVARRLDELDFTVGDEPFKMRFANQVRHNLHFRILKTRRWFWIGRGLTVLRMRARETSMGRSLSARARNLRDTYLPAAREAIRKRGLGRFIVSISKRLFKRLIFEHACVLFFEIPVGRTVEERDNVALAGVQFREARIDDLLEFHYSEYEAVRREFIRQVHERFKRGDRCFMAEYSGNAVYVAWSREEDKIYVSEARTWVSIGSNAVSLYDGMTVPAFRNKGLGQFTLSRALNALKDKRRITYCLSTNKPSEWYLLKCGFQMVQRYHLIRILGIPIRWRTDVPARVLRSQNP
jgi:CelD/BcsL family acetyltransferase involved in cellulose biosynthesis/GNAT superfamily N-acetyltransferase